MLKGGKYDRRFRADASWGQQHLVTRAYAAQLLKLAENLERHHAPRAATINGKHAEGRARFGWVSAWRVRGGGEGARRVVGGESMRRGSGGRCEDSGTSKDAMTPFGHIAPELPPLRRVRLGAHWRAQRGDGLLARAFELDLDGDAALRTNVVGRHQHVHGRACLGPRHPEDKATVRRIAKLSDRVDQPATGADCRSRPGPERTRCV